MNKRMSVRFCNIELENPCLLASASPTQSKEGIAKAFKLGWAGAVTKTCVPNTLLIGEKPNRFATWRDTNGNIVGFENLEGLTQKPIEYWEKAISELKNEFPTKVIIASVMADASKQSWQELAKRMEGAGADAIELNLSCPHFLIDNNLGAAIGKSKDSSAEITTWVKSAVKIPVMAKLTPNVTDIASVAKAVVAAGSDAVAAINTVQCLMGVDIEALEPLPAVSGYSAFGGYSGQAVKPIGLRCVAQIAQAVDVPIQGIGGIAYWQDIIQYMAVGANCVQVCTEVMINGYKIIKDILVGLEEYAERKQLDNLSTITGKAVEKIVIRESIDVTRPLRATVVEREKCTMCAKCFESCSESGKAAISFKNKSISIDSSICDGCSLCTHVCPNQVLALK